MAAAIALSSCATPMDLVEHFCNPDHSGKDIIPRILERQSLDVDAVSGATRSSATILKAVEKALEKGSL